MSDPTPFPANLQSALDRFDEFSNSALQARESADAMDAPLYHYSDANGLKGIVESEQIWFTSFRHLNDPSELRFGMDVTRASLNEIGGDTPSPRRFFCKCVEDLFRPDNFHSNIEFFIASFSKERDDLGQWRAYGANGRGFALGLAHHLFAIENKTNRLPHENVFVSSVVYGERAARALVAPAIERAAALIEEVNSDGSGVLADRSIGMPFVREMVNRLMSGSLVPSCLIAKHDAYAHEREVRLMIVGLETALRPYIETRTRQNEIVPFIRSAMPIRSGGIAEIVAGPAADTSAVDGLRTFLRLKSLDGDALVRHSTIPYRPV